MPTAVANVSDRATRQYSRPTQATQSERNYIIEPDLRADASRPRRLDAAWVELFREAPQPLAAAAAAISVNGLVAATQHIWPALFVPTVGVQVGMTLGAIAFGWLVVEHRGAALGGVFGAAIGAGIVTLMGLTYAPLALGGVMLAICFGASLGHQLFVAPPAARSGPSPLAAPSTSSHSSVHPAGARAPRRVAVALAVDDAQVGLDGLQDDAAWAAWRESFRRKLELLEGPYAATYRAKGLYHLANCEGPQTEENARSAQSWLKKFDRLLETLQPVAPLSEREAARVQHVLEQEFESIWGNARAKTAIRTCTELQQLGAPSMGLVCITGDSGTGKNRLANAAKKAYEIHHEINLVTQSSDSLTGFLKTYVDSEPSVVTELLMKSPRSFCVLHIDKVDKASREQQRALLSLLAPQNEFKDAYFGVPIHKERLFVVCTMVGDEAGLANLEPALWDRLKQHVVATSDLTPEGFRDIAQHALEQRCAQLRVTGVSRAQFKQMASEICRHVPDDAPGRYIENAAHKVVDTAAVLERRTGMRPTWDDALVLRAVHETWSCRQTIVLEHSWRGLRPRLERIECLTLCAILQDERTHYRWHVDLEDGHTLTVEVERTQPFKIERRDRDGALVAAPTEIDMRLLAHLRIESNELFDSDSFSSGSYWPTESWTRSGHLRTFIPMQLGHFTPWARRIDRKHKLLALPVVLGRTPVSHA